MLFLTLTLSLFLFIGSTTSLECNVRARCLSVTQQLGFVDCVAGQCVCLTASGFIGNASLENKCRCDTPSKVYYADAGEPYCYVFADGVAYKNEKSQEEFQASIVRSVYDNLVFPGPRNIMVELIIGQNTTVYNYFADNAVGRVDPVGVFSSHDGIVEYFYGLTWTGAARINKVVFKKLISQNNIVHSNVVMSFDLYDQAQQNIVFSYNLTQSGSFTFDANKKIKSVDLIIHNLGAISNQQSPQTPEYIQQVCYIILNIAGCNATHDPTGFYADFPACIQSFSQYKWGSYDNLYFDGNNAICRFFHALLAIGQPHTHCSHAGITGGGKCIQHDYATYYNKDYKKRSIRRDSL